MSEKIGFLSKDSEENVKSLNIDISGYNLYPIPSLSKGLFILNTRGVMLDKLIILANAFSGMTIKEIEAEFQTLVKEKEQHPYTKVYIIMLTSTTSKQQLEGILSDTVFSLTETYKGVWDKYKPSYIKDIIFKDYLHQYSEVSAANRNPNPLINNLADTSPDDRTAISGIGTLNSVLRKSSTKQSQERQDFAKIEGKEEGKFKFKPKGTKPKPLGFNPGSISQQSAGTGSSSNQEKQKENLSSVAINDTDLFSEIRETGIENTLVNPLEIVNKKLKPLGQKTLPSEEIPPKPESVLPKKENKPNAHQLQETQLNDNYIPVERRNGYLGVYLITGEKDSGKTTTCKAFGEALSKSRFSVVLIDLDLSGRFLTAGYQLSVGNFGTGSSWNLGLITALKSPASVDNCMYPISDEFLILGTAWRLSATEEKILTESKDKLKNLPSLIRILRQMFDVVLIDCPIDTLENNDNLLDSSDLILWVSRCNYKNINLTVTDIINTPFQDTNSQKYFRSKLKVILNDNLEDKGATIWNDFFKNSSEYLDEMGRVQQSLVGTTPHITDYDNKFWSERLDFNANQFLAVVIKNLNQFGG